MAENNLVQIQQIGISTANLATFTGKDRVLVVNTDTHRLHVRDGKTPGGLAVPLMSDLTDPEAADVTYSNYGYNNVGEALDALLYQKIEITSFGNNVNQVEMGSTVTSVTLNWNYNKTPKTLTLDDQQLDVSLKTTTLSELNLTQNKTFTLKATDEKNATATRTTGVTFLNGAYTGVGTVDADGVTNEFIQSLTKALASGKGKTFTVNAAEGSTSTTHSPPDSARRPSGSAVLKAVLSCSRRSITPISPVTRKAMWSGARPMPPSAIRLWLWPKGRI